MAARDPRADTILETLRTQFPATCAELGAAGIAVEARVESDTRGVRVKIGFARDEYAAVVETAFTRAGAPHMYGMNSMEFAKTNYVFDVVPLSAKNDGAWRHATDLLNMPASLRSMARASELVLALAASLTTAERVGAHWRDLLETVEIGGVAHYTGHGGGMPVAFACRFAETDTLSA